MVIQTLIVTASLYAAPRALSRFSARMDNPQASRVHYLRNRMAILSDQVRFKIGEKQWFLLTDVLADNAWIAFFLVSHAVNWNWQGALAKRPFDAANAFLALCGVTWLVRLGICKSFPTLGRYVGFRNN